MKLVDWAYLASVGGALIALVTLAVTSLKHRMDERMDRIREWQRVVIFQALEDGPKSIDEIDQIYGRTVQQRGDLPLREINRNALVREILRLQADGVIQRNPDRSYALRADAHSDLRDELMRALIERGQRADRMMAAEHTIVSMVQDKPSQLSENSILLNLNKRLAIDLSEHEIGYILRSMEMRNVLERDDDGKFKLGIPGMPRTITRTVTKTRTLPKQNFRKRSLNDKNIEP